MDQRCLTASRDARRWTREGSVEQQVETDAAQSRPQALLAKARAHPRETALVCLLASASIAAILSLGDSSKARPSVAGDPASSATVPLVPPPLIFRDLAPEQAAQANKAIPFSSDPNLAAKAFIAATDTEVENRARECLTAAIYYEAAIEPPEGQRAVAQVVLNRVRHPAFPASVCEVVFQGSTRRTGCQFSFTCDGSLRRSPVPALWKQAREIADEALKGAVEQSVGLATHYHANYVVPYWATSLAKNAVVGTHIFYRWPGGWGRPRAFSQRYAARELDPRVLSTTALLAHGRPSDGPVIPPVLPIQVSADPRVELISVVQRLAARASSGGRGSLYENNIEAYFPAFAEHPAVQQFRALPQQSGFNLRQAVELMLHLSPPPSLKPQGRIPQRLVSAVGGAQAMDAFLASLRDFAAASNFGRFYRDHRPYYASFAGQAAKDGGAALTRLEAYSGVSLAERKVIVSPLLQGFECRCRAPSAGGSWVLFGSVGQGDIGRIAGYEFAHRLLDEIAAQEGRARPWSGSDQKEQIVQALLGRAATASLPAKSSPPPAGAALAKAGQDGPLAARLKVYEARRNDYPTLGHFLQTLMAKGPVPQGSGPRKV